MGTFSEGGREILRSMSIQRKLAEDADPEIKLKDDPWEIVVQLVGIMENSVSTLHRARTGENWALVKIATEMLEEYAAKAWEKVKVRHLR